MKTSLVKFTQFIALSTTLLLVPGCQEDEVAIAPKVSTVDVTEITFSSAKIGGSIISNGGADVIAKGIAYSTSPTPTVARDTTNQGQGSAAFVTSLSELLPNTLYHARAYATNKAGTSYGEEVEFTTQMGLPVVTLEVSNPVYDQISVQVSITDEGASAATTIGVYYSRANDVPTSSDLQYVLTNGAISFSTGITNLTPGTKYNFRAVAINAQGTAYSSVASATTINLPNVTDGDGSTYPSVLINGKVWMAVNMTSTTFMNGDAIPTTVNNISGESTPVYRWAYDNNSTNSDNYGQLYTWYAATDSRKLCPSGWHLPTYAELNTLGANGAPLMVSGTTVWNTNVGTNTTGFNGRGAGLRYTDATFGNLKNRLVIWSTDTDLGNAGSSRTKMLGPDVGDYITEYGANKQYGASVRCVKD